MEQPGGLRPPRSKFAVRNLGPAIHHDRALYDKRPGLGTSKGCLTVSLGLGLCLCERRSDAHCTAVCLLFCRKREIIIAAE